MSRLEFLVFGAPGTSVTCKEGWGFHRLLRNNGLKRLVSFTLNAMPNEPIKCRATAKDVVRQTWQERRRTVVERPVPPVSVCYTVKNTWTQFWKELVESNHKPPQQQSIRTASSAPARETKRQIKSHTAPRPQFASVVSMLQKNEIVRQVKSIQEEATLKEVLSVLPTGYNWTKAIKETASKRSRAFWLLDLSVIVRNFVSLKRPGVRYVYDVHLSTNADPVLLKVLLRSNIVSLSTTTKWDIDRCKSVLPQGDTTATEHPLIVDSAVCCGKPDGYIREWIRLHPLPAPLVVNGAREVHRIAATVQRIRNRSPLQVPTGTTLEFTLRLEGEDLASWRASYEEIIEAIESCHGCLVGISVHVPETPNEDFIARVEHLLDHMQQSPEYIVMPQLKLDLRGSVIGSDGQGLLLDANAWLVRLSQRHDVAIVTVDVTKLLLASAGALCTRVIGVREQEVDGEQSDPRVRRHYYIDDGCYGSLCVVKDNSSITPFPLIAHNPESSSDSPPTNYETCIWGPTCDGLDRVCQNIELPAMQRDDWLVFAGMSSGSEGLSTAFNGFDPPDTAYCVLGYFGQ